MVDTPLFDMQASRGMPLSSQVVPVSDPLLPQQATRGLLSHFFDEIYDLRPESHLSRLLSVLLGDAGAGRVRKQTTFMHLSQMLQTAHFYDIDRLFADVFGFRRFMSEGLDFDPATESATMAEWEAVLAADASYRNRVEQFVRGIAWGPTPYGLTQVCSAVLGHPVHIYESYVNVDIGSGEGFNIAEQMTYGELEEFTYSQIEGMSYGEAEGTPDFEKVSPFEIGPGSDDIGDPTDVPGLPALSTTPEIDEATTLYYEYVPDDDLTLVVDTSLSVLMTADEDVLGKQWPVGAKIEVEILGGGIEQGREKDQGREIVTIEVEDSVPLDIGVSYVGPGEIRERVSIYIEGKEIDPWNPYSPPPLVPSRTNFTVRPLRPITAEEKYHLIRVLDRLKPVNSRAIIDVAGVDLIDNVTISGVYSPSSYWSILSEVIPAEGMESAYARTGGSGEAIEQPSAVFNEYQGEEWHYNGDILAVVAYAEDETGVFQSTNYERLVDPTNNKPRDFTPEGSILSAVDVLRGRVVRDGVLATSPIERSTP